jgi:hypothetical protein
MDLKIKKLAKKLEKIQLKSLKDLKKETEGIKNYLELKKTDQERIIITFTIIASLIGDFDKKQAKEIIKSIKKIDLNKLCND